MLRYPKMQRSKTLRATPSVPLRHKRQGKWRSGGIVSALWITLGTRRRSCGIRPVDTKLSRRKVYPPIPHWRRCHHCSRPNSLVLVILLRWTTEFVACYLSRPALCQVLSSLITVPVLVTCLLHLPSTFLAQVYTILNLIASLASIDNHASTPIPAHYLFHCFCVRPHTRSSSSSTFSSSDSHYTRLSHLTHSLSLHNLFAFITCSFPTWLSSSPTVAFRHLPVYNHPLSLPSTIHDMPNCGIPLSSLLHPAKAQQLVLRV